jgi:hypothetical protein
MRALHGLPEGAGAASDRDRADRRLRTGRRQQAQDGWKREEREAMGHEGMLKLRRAQGAQASDMDRVSRCPGVPPEGRQGR